jgi:hypothetical protein
MSGRPEPGGQRCQHAARGTVQNPLAAKRIRYARQADCRDRGSAGRRTGVVILTTVLDQTWRGRTGLTFVDDPQMINVAVSRAIQRFILVTNYDIVAEQRYAHMAVSSQVLFRNLLPELGSRCMCMVGPITRTQPCGWSNHGTADGLRNASTGSYGHPGRRIPRA